MIKINASYENEVELAYIVRILGAYVVDNTAKTTKNGKYYHTYVTLDPAKLEKLHTSDTYKASDFNG